MKLQDKLHAKLAGSQKLFEDLEDQGADMDAVHTIEYYFLASTVEPLKQLADTADFLGFGFSEIEEGNDPSGEKYYYADVLSRTPILSEDFGVFIPAAREAALMVLLSDTHGVEYDGWGTKMIKK